MRPKGLRMRRRAHAQRPTSVVRRGTVHRYSREGTRFWAVLSLTSEQKQNIHDLAPMQQLAVALPIEQVAMVWTISAAIKH